MKGANLALAFAVELAALAAVGTWGWSAGTSTIAHVLVAAVAVIAWAAVWGVFFSPKAAVALPSVAKAVGQWLMLALGALAFAATGRSTAAVVLAVAVVLNRVLLVVWNQSGMDPSG